MTLYEVLGEVALLPTSPAEAGHSQLGGTSQPTSYGRVPTREGSGAPVRTRSSPVRRKNTESIRSGKGQSPAPKRMLDRSSTPDRAMTTIRRRTSERERTLDRGKALRASVPNCQMLEPFAPPPSRAASTKHPLDNLSLGRTKFGTAHQK